VNDDDKGKLEVQLRILGNELIAIKMAVDDFKMKWFIMGILAIVALGWAANAFAPGLINAFGGN
jgi:hypothetical protein